MKFEFKSLLPHLVAIGIFLVIACIFGSHGFNSSLSLNQPDVEGVKGWVQQSYEYKETHGRFPLWNVSMFCGMPAFQIIFGGGGIDIIGIIDKIFQLWLPQPVNYIFLSCICFYIMCQCFKINPWASILGSIAFAFCSYFPIIIAVGHLSKVTAIAYAPAVIGGFILLLNREYLKGFFVTLLFTILQLRQNHIQISYYLFIIMFCIGVYYLINAIKSKQLVSLLKGAGLALCAGLFAVATTAVFYLPVQDMVKYTKRGGVLVMDNKNSNSNTQKQKTDGLDIDYAFDWSYGISETLSLAFPAANGYGMHYQENEEGESLTPELTETSNIYDALSEIGLKGGKLDGFTKQTSQNVYWGNQPFTTGPIFAGSIICLLALMAIFLDIKEKWWILAALIIGFVLSWGKNFPAVNNFLFYNLPFYKIFRAPSTAMVFPQWLLPLLASLTIAKIIDTRPSLIQILKSFAISCAALLVLGVSLYGSGSFSKIDTKRKTEFTNILQSSTDEQTFSNKMDSLNRKYKPLTDNLLFEKVMPLTEGNVEQSNKVLKALKKDRKFMLLKNIIISFLLFVVVGVLIFAFAANKLSKTLFLVLLTFISSIEVISFARKYLNQYNYIDKEVLNNQRFAKQNYDEIILKDKDPNFRVLDVTVDFSQSSTASYYHKSLGGYHPAKLGAYDDLITYQIGKNNMNVLNMLNAKYFITQNPDGKTKTAQLNPFALGNCWFVKGVKLVDGPVAEMKALDNLNTKDSAVGQISDSKFYEGIVAADSSSKITQTKFDNEEITYEANAKAKHLAVFSEIFYKDWVAYIDGQKADILKVNYTLRGLVIPQGVHKIEFKFEPKVFNQSMLISTIASWAAFACLVVLGFLLLRRNRTQSK